MPYHCPSTDVMARPITVTQRTVIAQRRWAGMLMSLLATATLLCAGCTRDPQTGLIPVAVVSQDVLADSRRPSGIDLSLIDRSVSPGDDFYSFANGSWLATTSLPNGYDQYGFFNMVDDGLKMDLLSFMRPVDHDPDADDLTGVVQTLFLSAMNQTAIDSIGLSALSPELRMVDSVRSLDDLTPVLAYLQLIGVTPFFKIHRPVYWELGKTNYLYLRQTSLGLANNDILSRGSGDDVVLHYGDFMRQVFQRLGENTQTASSHVDMVLAMEKRLGALAMSEPELRDFRKNYNEFKPGKLCKLTPGFDWRAFFSYLGAGKTAKVVVGQPAYFKEIGRLIGEQDWELVRTYLKWALLLEYAPYLSSDFQRIYQDFKDAVKQTTSAARPRDLTVVDIVNGEVPDAVGALYLGKFFPDTTRATAMAIVGNLKVAFGNRLRNNPWLSDKTKKKALKKLAAMKVRIGGSEQRLSYNGVGLAQGEFVRNIMKVREYRMRDHVSRAGQAVNPDEWNVHPQSANSWYRPTQNAILLPAGGVNELLRPEADDAYNYGVFGARVAHEMTHGFDRQGRIRDWKGRRKNWWTKKDIAGFHQRAQELVKHYNGFTVLDGQPVDGEKTLDENIADLGGLCIAFDAYLLFLNGNQPPVLDGYSGQQRFFLAYAQQWREILSEYAMGIRMKGWHAPPRFRTNGPVYQLGGFYEAFPEAAAGRWSLHPSGTISIW